MQQYERDHDKKQKLIEQLEKDQRQLLFENNALSEQLYQIRSKTISGQE